MLTKKRVVSPTVRAILFGLVLALAVFFLGPRNAFGPDAPADRPAPPPDIAQLDGWLQRTEAEVADLRPGLAKGVVWHGPPGQRTAWAVVYLHGFGASRLETAPLAEQVAERLGANLFQTRLSGHGRTPAAMGEATVQDWLADTVEAVRIGQLLGERVLVIGVSTGATLANWLALRPEGQAVAAHVFISPNYGPADRRTELINGPWGHQIARWITGGTVGSPSGNPREDHAWTKGYPTEALFPMMALVKRVRESDLSAMRAPLLVLFAEGDQTVDPAEIRAAFERIGSPDKTLEAVTYSEAKHQHVLAGDLRAPKATAPMAGRIAAWVQGLGGR